MDNPSFYDTNDSQHEDNCQVMTRKSTSSTGSITSTSNTNTSNNLLNNSCITNTSNNNTMRMYPSAHTNKPGMPGTIAMPMVSLAPVTKQQTSNENQDSGVYCL